MRLYLQTVCGKAGSIALSFHFYKLKTEMGELLKDTSFCEEERLDYNTGLSDAKIHTCCLCPSIHCSFRQQFKLID